MVGRNSLGRVGLSSLPNLKQSKYKQAKELKVAFTSLLTAEWLRQLVGAKRSKPGRNRSDESYQEKRRKEPLGNESLQTISKRLCECWLRKNLCIILPNRRTVTFRVVSMCSYMVFVLSAIFYFNIHHARERKKWGDHFGCQKRKKAVRCCGKFSFGPIRSIVSSGSDC